VTGASLIVLGNKGKDRMLIEKHYNVKELCEMLGWTRHRVYRRFKGHPLVMKDGNRIFVPHSVVAYTIQQLRLPPNLRPVRPGPRRKKSTTSSVQSPFPGSLPGNSGAGQRQSTP
jgi:hypothetical protein